MADPTRELRPEDLLHFVQLDEFADDLSHELKLGWIVGTQNPSRARSQSKTMASKSSVPSVGKKITSRLKNFVESVESGEDLTKRFTCRTVRLHLEPQQYYPDLVKETRGVLGASQAIFAQFLGVSVSAVQDWEQGEKPPKGSACRLMDEIRRDPAYWLKRLQELSTPVSS